MKNILVKKDNTSKQEKIAGCEYLSKGYYEDKKSKFYSYIFSVSSKEEVLNIIEKMKKEYKDARHVVHAYVLDNDFYYSDDGEPSGTAGKMIYSLMEKQNITNTLIVVVRYFGGVLLGVGPLARAYLKTVKNAEECLKLDVYMPREIIEVECTYKEEAMLRNIIEGSQATVMQVERGETVKYKLSINKIDKTKYTKFKIF